MFVSSGTTGSKGSYGPVLSTAAGSFHGYGFLRFRAKINYMSQYSGCGQKGV